LLFTRFHLIAFVVLAPLGARAADMTVVSAASFKAPVSPTSIAVAMNVEFETAGAAVSVIDSAGTARAAVVLATGQGQVTFRVPPQTATGAATVSVMNSAGTGATAVVEVATVAPALFSANGNGHGPASAVVAHLAADGTVESTTPTFTCGEEPGSCVNVPISVSPVTGRTILELFGTGIRGRTRLSRVAVRVGRILVPVSFAGAQGSPGLDQVNVVLPSNLAGLGLATVVLTADNATSNSVTINLSATTFYVSPSGSDSYSGLVPSRPFATPAQAQTAARDVHNGRIVMREGVYSLTEPVNLTAADSHVTWESYPGESPVLSGGQTITDWSPSASVPGAWEASIAGLQPFEQLWVGGARRYRVRVLAKEKPGYFHNLGPVYVTTPNGCTNRNVPQGFTQSQMISAGKYECFDRFFFRTGDIDPAWSGLKDRAHPIQIVDFEDWTIARLRLTSISDASGIAGAPGNASLAILASATVPGQYWGFLNGHRFLIENVKEALTAEHKGEWYVERDRIYYVPAEGEDFSADPPEVIAPQLMQLVVSSDAGLTGLTMRGLTFAYTNWIAGAGYSGFSGSQQAARENVPAALSFGRGSGITLDGITIEHAGGWGLEFGAASNCKLENSVITDLGSGAIRIGAEPAASDTDESVTHSNLISNNVLASGDRMLAGIAITIENSHDNTIDHNDIYDFYNVGINMGRALNFDANGLPNWVHDNKITYNHIYDLGQGVTSDIGAVHTATGLQTGNVLDHNTFHDIAHDPTGNGYGGWGVYLDQGSSFVTVTNNLVYNTSATGFTYNASQRGAYLLNGTPNLIANNIFAFGTQASVHRNNNDGALNFTFRNNIVYWDQTHPLPGQPSPGAPSPQDGTWACAGTPVTCYAFSQNMYYSTVDPSAATWRFVVNNRAVTLAQWQAMPQPAEDLGSTIDVDPLFVAPLKGDFTLRDDSPAGKAIGFVPFDFRAAGRVDRSVVPAAVVPGFPLQVPASY
jgi:uncharacterized protein (TIGR03437 family)